MNASERPAVAALKKAYRRGENIMALLSAGGGDAPGNDFGAIQTSYDLQAGSYTAFSNSSSGARLVASFAEALVPHLEGFRTILDAGVGEATTLAPVMKRLGASVRAFGFDASVSRLLWARKNLVSSTESPVLFVADTAEIPLCDASVELVLSVHSIEPNGGKEPALLTELLRVAGRRLVLIEPSTTYASEAQLERMRRLGYCMDLPEALEALGANIALHEPWPVNANPNNAAEIIVVDLAPQEVTMDPQSGVCDEPELVAPSSLADLVPVDAGLYSVHDGLYFPVVGGLPVLTRAQAVIATQLLDGV